MKIQYFEDTDTLYIEFREEDIVETKDLDVNTTLPGQVPFTASAQGSGAM